jgi:hypothetical protein
MYLTKEQIFSLTKKCASIFSQYYWEGDRLEAEKMIGQILWLVSNWYFNDEF